MCHACGWTKTVAPGAAATVGLARSVPSPAPETTTLFRGGLVYTLDPRRPWAQAVAVRGRDIIAVGSDAEARAAAGAHARVIDLAGRLVLPGFVEAHTHPLLGGFLTSGVDLQVPTKADALAAVADYARTHVSGPVCGFGWRMDMFGPDGPHREDLDAILPDRPALLFAIDGHSLWVNSKTLQIAGVTADSADPVPGFSYCARDADGQPTGFVLETPAMLRIADAVTPMTKTLLAQLFQAWLPKAAAAGITAVFDAGLPPDDTESGGLASVYVDLETQDRLPFRVVACHLVKEPPVDNAVQQALTLKDFLDGELVRAGVLKIVGDGTAEGHTAYLLAPYADRPDSCGQSPFSEDQWRRLVIDADAAGLDVHIHAIGDRTVRLALDAIEAAMRANAPRDRRHAIAHLQFIDDTDLPRFGELGVIAQFSANWFSADPGSVDTTIQRCGIERQRRMYLVKTLLDRGAAVTFGTDWPAAGWFSTYKPLDAIQVAMTRQLIGSPSAPALEPTDQRLSLAQALEANTLAAARQLRLDHLVGSLQTGKRADLVVLQRNLFELPAERIAATPVDMTMMNGRFTHGG